MVRSIGTVPACSVFMGEALIFALARSVLLSRQPAAPPPALTAHLIYGAPDTIRTCDLCLRRAIFQVCRSLRKLSRPCNPRVILIFPLNVFAVVPISFVVGW